MSRALAITLAIAIVLLLLSCAGVMPPHFIFVMYLTIGWIEYLVRVVPQTQVNWTGVLSAVLCLAGVIVLGNWIGRWLFREASAGRVWKLRWTLSLVTIVVLMFVAGIGAVGFTHQSVWLARSDQPMFEYAGRERVNRIKCASNLRQIGHALTNYAQDHNGLFPDTLADLLMHDHDISPQVFVCPASNSENAPGPTTREQASLLSDYRYCSYIYHGRGLKLPLDPKRPIVCEPLKNHDQDGMNVLFGDGHVEWLSPAHAQAAMDQR